MGKGKASTEDVLLYSQLSGQHSLCTSCFTDSDLTTYFLYISEYLYLILPTCLL